MQQQDKRQPFMPCKELFFETSKINMRQTCLSGLCVYTCQSFTSCNQFSGQLPVTAYSAMVLLDKLSRLIYMLHSLLPNVPQIPSG